MGPAAGAAPNYPPLEEDLVVGEGGDGSGDQGTTADGIPQPPGSPYSAEREAIRSLTMPAVPDTAIPASPPGSPSPALRAVDKKFAQFLELKRKGVHFNAKVAGSPALANPALADKLLAFVGIGASAGDGENDAVAAVGSSSSGSSSSSSAQYATTLSPDIWNPAAFPRYAFREQLRAAQAEGAQARARGRGAAVDFVPATATNTATATTSAAVAAAPGASSTGKRKTRFDK